MDSVSGDVDDVRLTHADYTEVRAPIVVDYKPDLDCQGSVVEEQSDIADHNEETALQTIDYAGHRDDLFSWDKSKRRNSLPFAWAPNVDPDLVPEHWLGGNDLEEPLFDDEDYFLPEDDQDAVEDDQASRRMSNEI
jgi:hypothetical protein